MMPAPRIPADWNRYAYVRNNPINYTDPSGYCTGDPNDLSNPDIACWQKIDFIEATYSNIDIVPDNWQTNELEAVEKGLTGMTDVFGSRDVFYFVFDRTITLKRAGWWANLFAGDKQSQGVPRTATITFYDRAFSTNDDIGTVVVIHEFGHFLDARFGYLSMADFKDTFWDNCIPNPFTGDCWGLLNPQCKPFPFGQPSSYGQTSPKEDFAETFAEYVWFENGWNFTTVSSQILLPDYQRLDYMESLIASILNASNSSK
jgi:hypothetical protein